MAKVGMVKKIIKTKSKKLKLRWEMGEQDINRTKRLLKPKTKMKKCRQY